MSLHSLLLYLALAPLIVLLIPFILVFSLFIILFFPCSFLSFKTSDSFPLHPASAPLFLHIISFVSFHSSLHSFLFFFFYSFFRALFLSFKSSHSFPRHLPSASRFLPIIPFVPFFPQRYLIGLCPLLPRASSVNLQHHTVHLYGSVISSLSQSVFFLKG